MDACGKVRKEQAPEVLKTKADIVEILEKVPNLAVIVKDRESFRNLCEFVGDEANRISYVDTKTSEMIDSVIPCFSVFAAKGLEFPEVLVWPENMTNNQKVVACSRALNHLYYSEQ